MGNKVNEICGMQARHKMSLLWQSWRLNDEELGRFLRENGLVSSELEMWKEQMEEGLQSNTRLTTYGRRELRKEINKLKAQLAEAKAIIDAQKKTLKLLGKKEKK